MSGHTPFTTRAKKVFERSLSEAMQLGHDRTGTEHIPLGLLAEAEGTAATLLRDMAVDPNGRLHYELLSIIDRHSQRLLNVSALHM